MLAPKLPRSQFVPSFGRPVRLSRWRRRRPPMHSAGRLLVSLQWWSAQFPTCALLSAVLVGRPGEAVAAAALLALPYTQQLEPEWAPESAWAPAPLEGAVGAAGVVGVVAGVAEASPAQAGSPNATRITAAGAEL